MKENEIYLIDEYGLISTIKRRVKVKDRPNGGAESSFILLDKNIGLKGFKTKKEARSSRSRQRKAAKHGFGPQVLSEIIEVVMPVGGTYLSSKLEWLALRRAPAYRKKHRRLYAYKTEVVPKLFHGNCKFKGKDKEKYVKLVKLMEGHDFGVSDLHPKNVGLIGDRMVCLDFGDMSS